MNENLETSEIRIAVISDVHGNRWALEAVLEDIEKKKIDKILNLGDCLYGPLEPGGTADLLVRYNIPTVSGNEDRLIWEKLPGQEMSQTLEFVRGHLTPAHLSWLRSLEFSRTAYQFFFLCHGTPCSDSEYLLREVRRAGVFLRGKKDLLKKLNSVEQMVVLCGHDHVPGLVQLNENRFVVNPGSVGLPAYNDDLPFPHVMETGSFHSQYCIISGYKKGWKIEHVSLPYNWQAAAEKARKNSRPDWAEWLKTGRARLEAEV